MPFPSDTTELQQFSPGKQAHVRLLKVLRLKERFVVTRGDRLQTVQKGRVGPIYPQQLTLPDAVIQGARVEVRERLLRHDGTAEALLA